MNWELILLIILAIIAYGIMDGMKHVLLKLGKIVELLKIIQGEIVNGINKQTEANNTIDEIKGKLEAIERRINRLE